MFSDWMNYLLYLGSVNYISRSEISVVSCYLEMLPAMIMFAYILEDS